MTTQSTKPPGQGGATSPEAGPSPARRPPSQVGKKDDHRSSAGAGEAPLQPMLQDATATARSVADSVKETARDVAADARRTSAELGADLKQAAQSAQRAAKEQASAFAADVGHELNQSADEQKVRGAEAIQGFARAMNSAAGELEGQSPMVARYVRDAAHQVDALSGNLRSKSVPDLMHAASDLARAQPLLFIAGAMASGFALSRFLKSSASRSDSVGSGRSASAEGQAGTTPRGGDFNFGRS